MLSRPTNLSHVAREVFQAAASVSSILPSVHALTPSLALVPMLGGSCSTAFRISVPPKMSTFSKALAAPKEAPKEPPKEPIVVSESQEDNSEEGSKSLTLSVSPIRIVGNIVIGGKTTKRARTSKPVKLDPFPFVH